VIILKSEEDKFLRLSLFLFISFFAQEKGIRRSRSRRESHLFSVIGLNKSTLSR
jgi:hypothetical protein